jgi:hypothetical protein
MSLRPPTWIAAIACCAVLAACATPQRHVRLRELLDAHAIALPIEDVWPKALRLVGDRGFPLVGQDRERVGLPPQSALAAFVSRGHDTRVAEDRWVSETSTDSAQLRYRIEGTRLGPRSCRVVFTAVQGQKTELSEEQYRDVELELALVRELEPERAARMRETAERR